MKRKVIILVLAALIVAASASCAHTPAPESTAEGTLESVAVPTEPAEPSEEATEATRPEDSAAALSVLPEGEWTNVIGLQETGYYYSSGAGIPIDQEMLKAALELGWVRQGEAQEESFPAYVIVLEIDGQEWYLRVGSDGAIFTAQILTDVTPGRKQLSQEKNWFRDDGSLYNSLRKSCFSMEALLPELPWDYAEWVLFSADGNNMGQGDLDPEWMQKVLLEMEFTVRNDAVQPASDVYTLFMANSEQEPFYRCAIDVFPSGVITFRIQVAEGVLLAQNYTADSPLFDILTEKFFPPEE